MGWIKKFKRVPYLIHYLYEKITSSIAFYPSLIALFFFFVTSLMIYLEQNGLTEWLSERIPFFLIIKSWDVAQSVLTTLVGALISLMVFSFSMVMVLLNNAASNYSPRILPSLIANKFHQFVLGTYLGSITFCLLLAINMTPSQPDIPLPSFSVLLGIFLGLTCLMLFIFFIHSISESVQVKNIMESLTDATIQNLENGAVSKLGDDPLPGNSNSWYPYSSDRSGYLKSVDTQKLNQICQSSDLKMKVLVAESKFILDESNLFACNQELSDELLAKILKEFVFTRNEIAKDDHIIGFKQITEIALKAMSPGINDPGTALSAINYLTILFAKKLKLKEAGSVIIKDEKDEILPTRVWLNVISFEELLAFVLAPLRQYARHDLMVVLRMLEMLKFLGSRSQCQAQQLDAIKREIQIIKTDSKKYLTNEEDFKRVAHLIDSIYKNFA